MHIETLRKVKTIKDGNHLIDVFERLADEGVTRSDITKINGTSLTNPSFIAPICDMHDITRFKGHLIADLRDGKVALNLLDLKTNKLESLSDYKYKSIGVLNNDIFVCTHISSPLKDICFKGNIIIKDAEDISISSIITLFFVIVDYPNYHSLVCLNSLAGEPYNPTNFDDFSSWFTVELGKYKNLNSDKELKSAITYIFETADKEIFNEDYKSIDDFNNSYKL